MAFKKGQSGNLKGRPKTAHLQTAEKFQKSQQMITSGTEQLAQSWSEIVDALIKQAKRGNVPAATWLRDTFVGKPTETVRHDASDGVKEVISLAYKA